VARQIHELQLPPAHEVVWFQRQVLRWFKIHQRKFPWREKSASNYVKVLSEILLQRTRAETVGSFLPEFVKKFPSWNKLATASEQDLQSYFQRIGLWRRRASTVERLAKEMARRSGRFPRTRTKIEELPNVGQYIANAILLFCHGQPEPLLDANMARVLERYFGPRKLADIRYDPYLQALARMTVSSKQPVVMNWSILDLAAVVCKSASPRCESCPLVVKCKYARQMRIRVISA
jgi:A/G-specific adenine glycosylase